MAISYIVRPEWIATAVGVASNGDPFRVDGSAFDLHILVAPSNFTIQVSMDGVNWVTGTDADAVALNALGAGVYRIARERPAWVRAQVAADAGGPRQAVWVVGVMKEV